MADALTHRPVDAARHSAAENPAAAENPVGWPGEPAPEGGRIGWPGDLPPAAPERPGPAAASGSAHEPVARRSWRRLFGAGRVA
ncbi:hypothetical protein [Blastococcus haudaquaticus]|uniref:hypothetical protein n=1 Tax=Blastococcus haudaquaticus TaxID=1938745 RepID=UPI001177B211|nr:hypothetical protein [Blastococcus haudaquaticus]